MLDLKNAFITKTKTSIISITLFFRETLIKIFDKNIQEISGKDHRMKYISVYKLKCFINKNISVLREFVNLIGKT